MKIPNKIQNVLNSLNINHFPSQVFRFHMYDFSSVMNLLVLKASVESSRKNWVDKDRASNTKKKIGRRKPFRPSLYITYFFLCSVRKHSESLNLQTPMLNSMHMSSPIIFNNGLQIMFNNGLQSHLSSMGLLMSLI